MYTILTFIVEGLCFVTHVQLFSMTVKAKVSTSLVLLGWFLWYTSILISNIMLYNSNTTRELKIKVTLSFKHCCMVLSSIIYNCEIIAPPWNHVAFC